MQFSTLAHSRVGAVLAGAALLVTAGGVGGAMASSGHHGDDHGRGGDHGRDHGRDHDDRGNGPKWAPRNLGVNWQIIDRNVIGNGDSYLRTGPNSANFGVTVDVPFGVGSLGMRTGSGEDKATFGNQVDFAGDALADIEHASYWVYTTGENKAKGPGNLPNLQFEVSPDGQGGFSTLVYVPEAAEANTWTELDASEAKRWYLTGAEGEATGCNQVTYCTLDEVQAELPDATIYTVQFSKGRDHAFSGAVDGLALNDTTYDFEPYGVVTR
ncbi:MAG TPA: hypothetical protein VFM50_10875 [Nocardioidaceae bacterium]|nr:hypothetical protein [Nocardioidaceae bacterium]